MQLLLFLLPFCFFQFHRYHYHTPLLWVNTTFFPMSISVFSVFLFSNHIPSRRCFIHLLTTPSSVNFLYETKQPCRFGGKYFDRGKLGEGENMCPCTSVCMYVCVYALGDNPGVQALVVCLFVYLFVLWAFMVFLGLEWRPEGGFVVDFLVTFSFFFLLGSETHKYLLGFDVM